MEKVQVKPEAYEAIVKAFHGEIFRRKDKDGNCFMNVTKKQKAILEQNNLIVK
jgi:hypothetical protein